MSRSVTILLGIAFCICIGVPLVEAHSYSEFCEATLKITNVDQHVDVVEYGNPSGKSILARASTDSNSPSAIRVLAYEKAVACIRAAWERRDEDVTPRECSEANGIAHYEGGILADHLARTACAAWGISPGRTVHINVHAHVWGGNGCGGERNSNHNPWVAVSENQDLTCR